MEAIYMEQVNTAVGEIVERRIERITNQRRECSVPGIMIGAQLIVDFVTIVTCMFVTLPMVNAKAPRGKAERADGLEECAIGIARMNPEFNNHPRLQRATDPKSKRRVPQQCRR